MTLSHRPPPPHSFLHRELAKVYGVTAGGTVGLAGKSFLRPKGEVWKALLYIEGQIITVARGGRGGR